MSFLAAALGLLAVAAPQAPQAQLLNAAGEVHEEEEAYDHLPRAHSFRHGLIATWRQRVLY